jgi:hypothetical protein
MQMAVDLLLALTIAILQEVLVNQVIMLFIGVAVVASVVGIILSLTNFGRWRA